MKISNLSKALFVMLLIVMAMGAFTIHNLHKENRAIIAERDAKYDTLYVQSREREKAYGREKMVLVRRIDSLNVRIETSLRTIDSLGNKELKQIPKRYINKTNKELADLLEQRANGN